MRILNIALASYELYGLAGAMQLIRRPGVSYDLMAPKALVAQMPPELKSMFDNIYAWRLPNLSGSWCRDLAGALLFQWQVRRELVIPDVVCCGAYRSTVTNYLARILKPKVRFIGFRQGVVQDQEHFQRQNKRRALYYNVFNKLFGASLVRYRWGNESDYICSLQYMHDPVDHLVAWTEGPFQPQLPYETALPWPALAIKSCLTMQDETPAVLVVGERTPIFENCGGDGVQQYQDFLAQLKKRFSGYKLYFRPRQGLTDCQRLNLEGYEILDTPCAFEWLLLTRPWVAVVSIKSTASKQAAALGIPAFAAYPLFRLSPSLERMLDDFYAGNPMVIRPRTWEEISLPAAQLPIDLKAETYEHTILQDIDGNSFSQYTVKPK